LFLITGSLGYTTSQENLPNVEEVLHKVSNVVDLNSLNLSKSIDLNAFNSSVKQVLEDTKNAFKQKCDKNGGEGAFDNAQSAKDNLEQCFKSFINFTQLEEEMEKKKPTGDLDMVFKEYCRKTP
ncbi:27 kDa hemolymph protein, partial [Eufriesea mexicana]